MYIKIDVGQIAIVKVVLRRTIELIDNKPTSFDGALSLKFISSNKEDSQFPLTRN